MSNSINQNDIDATVDTFCNLILSSAEKTFGKSKPHSSNQHHKKPDKWFGHKCLKARKQFHNARYQYKRRKTLQNKETLKSTSKIYKQTINFYHTQFKKQNIQKLKKLKRSNPRKYWKILNGKRQEKTEADPDEMLIFFKKSNFDENAESHQNNANQTGEKTIHNTSINEPITESEVKKAISGLKNNKSCGIDSIVNEHLKSLSHIIAPPLVNIFNLVFDSGIIPESWTLGMIKPIYKNKGCKSDPANYRPITLISCLGKLFTSILNERLQKYADEHDLINDCQSGFRKGYSTVDNIFILHSLIELVCKSKRKLYCAFIDLKQAFDRVWRDGLWLKLYQSHINGKCLRIIQNMYSNIKSCILVNNRKTDFFISNIGVRQGENLSPFLFIMFLNDLEHFFRTHNVEGIICKQHPADDLLVLYLKIFILLYADDTVILSSSMEGLQHALNVYADYCNTWKLQVNQAKSKIVIFAKRKQDANYTFTLDNIALETVSEYKYLGILFRKNNSFFTTKKHIAEQGTKAAYSLLAKARNLHLPIDLQLELFEKLVKPILLYGCEIWGFGNIDVLERVQLNFIKRVLKVKRSTPNYIVYGETGIYPLKIEIESRVISYWGKLNCPENFGTLSTLVYSAMKSFYINCHINSRSLYFKWVHNIKTILYNTGYSGIWDSHTFLNKLWLTKTVKQKLKDIFLNEWYKKVENDTNYKIFKHKFEFEYHLTSELSNQCLHALISFRTRNHRLPVETGRWHGIEHNNRKCNLCNTDIGDEYHYLFSCEKLKEKRKRFLQSYYYKRPNTFKYQQLMNSRNKQTLSALSNFIKTIFETIKEN